MASGGGVRSGLVFEVISFEIENVELCQSISPNQGNIKTIFWISQKLEGGSPGIGLGERLVRRDVNIGGPL